jgi:hypothetical protein
MTRLLLAGAAALGMVTCAATARMATAADSTATSSTTSETTITTVPAPPVVVSSTRTTATATEADATRTATGAYAVRDNYGNESKTATTNKTYPMADFMTSVKKEQQTINGVTTETVTTTQTWPPKVGRPDVPPVVTTETHVLNSK